MRNVTAFLKQDAGGDLAEYGLLLAFVFIACLAIFMVSDDNLSGVWSSLRNLIGSRHGAAK